jgi:IS4 transposase
VSRLKDNARYKKIKELAEVKGRIVGELCLEEDLEVQLAAKSTRWLKPRFRLISATHQKSGARLMFITNIDADKMSAEEITEVYRKRWDIQVFFRFIKQELNAKHFLSRDKNGITVVMYMIMILATMLLIYKLSNKLSGYKIVKIQFKHELEMELIKELIIWCGGDPRKLKSNKMSKPFTATAF